MFDLFKKTPDDSAAPDKRSWTERLKAGLGLSREKLAEALSDVFARRELDEAAEKELEAALLSADVGVDATAQLLDDLKVRWKRSGAGADARATLAEAMVDLLAAARRAAGHRTAATLRHHACRRQRRGQDDIDRQAREMAAGAATVRIARRGRHLPRGGARAVERVGRAQWRGRDPAIGRRSRGGHVRRGRGGTRPEDRRRARRHRGTPADAGPPDGRIAQGEAGSREGAGGCAARGAARPRRQYRPERARAGQVVRRGRSASRGSSSPSWTGAPRAGWWPPSPSSIRFRCASSAWAKAWTTCAPSSPANSSTRCCRLPLDGHSSGQAGVRGGRAGVHRNARSRPPPRPNILIFEGLRQPSPAPADQQTPGKPSRDRLIRLNPSGTWPGFSTQNGRVLKYLWRRWAGFLILPRVSFTGDLA